MECNEFLKVTAVHCIMLIVQGISYTGIQSFQGPYHDMARPLDQKIPLVPQTIFVYILWFPLLLIYPLYLYIYSPSAYGHYFFAMILDIAVSLLIYLNYPTSFERPPAPEKGLSGWVFKLIRIGNYRGLNCMPSMHCSTCFLIIMSALGVAGTIPTIVIAGVCVLALGIICSTVLTKQHVVLDIAAALPLAVVCRLLGKIFLLALS